MRIRKLESHENALHRKVRLRALHDSPGSFTDTAWEAEQRPPSYWDDLTRSVTEPDRHVMFLACDGDAVVGSIYGLHHQEHGAVARIGGTWVAPAHRRRGVGRELLKAVISWAREHKSRRVALWVPSENAAALALYRQAGFKDTGRRQPLRDNAADQVVELECEMATKGDV